MLGLCGWKCLQVFIDVEWLMCVDSLVGFFFQAEDGIRDAQESRGLGDVYKRQVAYSSEWVALGRVQLTAGRHELRFECTGKDAESLSLIHI